MKILGILGGMGPQATVRFYSMLLQKSVHDYGKKKNADFPHIVIDSIPVPDLIRDKDDEERTVQIVEEEAKRLKVAGATVLAMPCNTMHLHANRFQAASGLPFLSMIDAVVARIKNDRVKRIGLMGTVTTMQSDLYIRPLKESNVDIVVPDKKDQEILGKLIHGVIADTITDEHREMFQGIVDRLMQKNIDAILLGCTELPILAEKITLQTIVYDSSAILADACCKELLG